jgi:hypothetical protein
VRGARIVVRNQLRLVYQVNVAVAIDAPPSHLCRYTDVVENVGSAFKYTYSGGKCAKFKFKLLFKRKKKKKESPADGQPLQLVIAPRQTVWNADGTTKWRSAQTFLFPASTYGSTVEKMLGLRQ